MARESRLANLAVATIANGASESNVITMSEYVIASIITPSGWDAAALTFLACDTEDGTFLPVYDDAGTEVTIPSADVVVDRVIVNKAVLEQLAGLAFVKLRSGVAALAVNQTASRTFRVILKS